MESLGPYGSGARVSQECVQVQHTKRGLAGGEPAGHGSAPSRDTAPLLRTTYEGRTAGPDTLFKRNYRAAAKAPRFGAGVSTHRARGPQS